MDVDWSQLNIVEGDEGLLIFGPESMLDRLDGSPDYELLKPSAQTMKRAANVFENVASLQEQSGRWLKLNDESAKWLKSYDIAEVASGVVRNSDVGAAGNAGSIVKHLGFEKAGLLTPAAPAAAAALIAQEALDVALDEIRDYLEEIDEKIEQLLAQQRIDAKSTLDGIKAAVLEAQELYKESGTVSDTTWSKISGVSYELQKLQNLALSQLEEVSKQIADKSRNSAKLSRAYHSSVENIQVWLWILAQAIAVQDRFYALELARVADYDKAHLDGHVKGIQKARKKRIRWHAERLVEVRSALRESAELSRFVRLQHPRLAPKITENANRIQYLVDRFAESTKIDLDPRPALELDPWLTAAREVAGETADNLNSFRKDTQDKVVDLSSKAMKQGGQTVEKLRPKGELRLRMPKGSRKGTPKESD